MVVFGRTGDGRVDGPSIVAFRPLRGLVHRLLYTLPVDGHMFDHIPGDHVSSSYLVLNAFMDLYFCFELVDHLG